jgi:IS4 transposase
MVRTSRSFDMLRKKPLRQYTQQKTKECTTGKGPWYVSVVKGLAMEWIQETFGKRNVLGRFYRRFLWNAKYEIVYR